MNQNRYSPNISDCGVILVPRCFAPMMFVTFLASTQALDFGLKLISVLTMQALPCPLAAKRLWQPSLSWTRWSSAAMQMPHAVCREVTAQTVAKQCVYTAPSVFRVWSLCPSPWIWGCRCWFSDTQKKRQQSHLPRPCHCCPEILRFANGKATIAVPVVVHWVLVPGWCSPVRSLRECTNAFHQTIILIDGIMIQWSFILSYQMDQMVLIDSRGHTPFWSRTPSTPHWWIGPKWLASCWWTAAGNMPGQWWRILSCSWSSCQPWSRKLRELAVLLYFLGGREGGWSGNANSLCDGNMSFFSSPLREIHLCYGKKAMAESTNCRKLHSWGMQAPDVAAQE